MIVNYKTNGLEHCIACRTEKNIKYFIVGTKVKDGLSICNECLKELSTYIDEDEGDEQ